MNDHTMPMLTDSERVKMISDCEEFIANPDNYQDWFVVMARITLAALTAESAGNFAYHEDEDGDPTDFIVESDGFSKNSFKLYTAPPVPSLKLPDEHLDDDGEATSESQMAWSASIAEIKRLNGVTE